MNSREIIKYIKENCHQYSSRGDEMIIVCPSCGDRKLHCHFNPHKKYTESNEIGFGICFKCGIEFNFTMLVAMVEGLNYYNAKKFLRNKELKGLNINRIKNIITTFFNKRKLLKSKDDFKQVINLPDEYNSFNYVKCNKDNKIYFGYLLNRGISLKEIKYWNIGYCDYGYYKYRIIFPVYCDSNKSFVARTIKSKEWFNKHNIKYKKYINPLGSKHHYLFYNYDNIKNSKSDYLCIVEGVTDVINLAKYNVPAVATFGKKISDYQIKLLIKLKINRILLVFDNDPKDNEEAIRLDLTKIKCGKRLCEFFDTTIIQIPEGKDVGVLDKQEVFDYIINLKNNKLKDLRKSINKVVNSI